jgi:hypothetical protein
VFFLYFQIRVVKAFEGNKTDSAKDDGKEGQQWISRIYTTGGSADREQQLTQSRGGQPGHVVHQMAAGTAAPQQQNRLSVDSWYYSLAEGSPNMAAGTTQGLASRFFRSPN